MARKEWTREDEDFLVWLAESGMVEWSYIAEQLGRSINSCRFKFKRLKAAKEAQKELPEEPADDVLTIEGRVRSLEDLLEAFSVDLDEWQVKQWKANQWEQHSVERGVVPLYQVKADLVPLKDRRLEIGRRVLMDMLEDIATQSPPEYNPVERVPGSGEEALLEVAVFDPHIGLYCWGEEVGANYDSHIAVEGYLNAVVQLASVHQWYNVDRILFPIGNDLLHVDMAVDGRGGTTTRGTQQDVDSRLAKMFTTARRAVIAAIDHLREIAPVDVVCVAGNHDEQRMFMLGEVIEAWYRHDPEVSVENSPRLRKFYQYGNTLLGFTHGLESKRKRDNLPLLMSTEAPPEMWATSKFREWHTGHYHTRFEVSWLPQFEEQGIRVRSLPSLAPEDAWHHREGYRHQRSAEAFIFKKSSGFAGLHSFNL